MRPSVGLIELIGFLQMARLIYLYTYEGRPSGGSGSLRYHRVTRTGLGVGILTLQRQIVRALALLCAIVKFNAAYL